MEVFILVGHVKGYPPPKKNNLNVFKCETETESGVFLRKDKASLDDNKNCGGVFFRLPSPLTVVGSLQCFCVCPNRA